MNTIYVCGHRHPDTDSIVSSIAYAYLKRELGIPAIACRLSDCNSETNYLLNRFGFDEPLLLEDARVRLHDIELEKPICVHLDTTIFETLNLMKTHGQPFVCVVDSKNCVLGIITRNDLADVGLGDTAFGIDLLKQVKLENICKTIQGKIIYSDDLMHLDGQVSIVALSQYKITNYEVINRIVIVGDDVQSQKALIQKGAGMLIVVWANRVDDTVIEEAKKYHCPIILSGLGTMNTSRYLFFAPEISHVMKKNVMCFYEDEYLEDVAKRMSRKRYRAYPVLNASQSIVGYILKDHAMVYKNKSLILVDHNEFSQSVPSIEKAEVLEVIDHHRVYDFYSHQPILFRNEIVGSTATIVTGLFIENQISIPSKLAGLLLGAIISDTLNFQSPTTTSKDFKMADYLGEVSGLNVDELAYSILFMNANSETKTVWEYLKDDVKSFEMEGYQVIIAQVVIPSCEWMTTIHESIEEELKRYVMEKNCDLVCLVFTSVADNGSYFYFSGKISNWFEKAFPQHIFIEKMISRKQQIVPVITEIIQKNV